MQKLEVKSFFSLEDYAHAALFDGTVYAWEALNALIPYLQNLTLGKIEVDIPKTVHLVNPSLISIGKGSIIEPGAYIEGPCVLGQDTVVRHGAYIRGHVVAGDKCVIGHSTEIKNSILLNQVSAAHFNYVGDCILGNNVNLGAGVKCANLRLDHQLVSFFVNGQKIVTNLKKLGAIIGDGSQLGCNAVTNPGTLMGKKSFCFPCVNFGGYVPEQTIVRLQKSV